MNYDDYVDHLAEKDYLLNTENGLIDRLEKLGYGVYFPLCDHPAFKKECKEINKEQKETQEKREEDGHARSE